MIARGGLLRMFREALAELDLRPRVAAALGAAPRREAHVIAIGKAAPAMAAGALDRWGEAITRCLVVAPDGTSIEALRREAIAAAVEPTILRAAHPWPDRRSVRAGEACLEAAARAGAAGAALLVLVSGGASALVCAPSAGLTLREKQAITRALLRSGASIGEVNVVRKHLSRVKGGGLLRAARGAAVTTLVASDIVGGTVSDVGSGPSVPDPTTVAEARAVLRRRSPEHLHVSLARSFSGGSAAREKIVAAPELLAKALAGRLRGQGLDARVLPSSAAPVEELAAEYLNRSRGPIVLVRAAEPSVALPARAGAGGRSAHLAALVGRGLAGSRRVLFAALASDGVDGSSETGGAVVDSRFAARAAERLGETALDRALARFDTGPLHHALGTAVPSSPTGHNLADVHVLVAG
ncbi:MAG: D-glycerate 2-kinase [Labilithrix sp.]|nr:D-glycerate 2-kinase [Labilithrix sp.]